MTWFDNMSWSADAFYQAPVGAQTNTGLPNKLTYKTSGTETIGSQTNTGVITRITNKTVIGALTSTGALIKTTLKTVAGALPFVGWLAATRAKIVSMLMDVEIAADGHLIDQPINEDE